MEARIAIADARRTLALARVRCLSFDALLDRLRNVLRDESPGEVVYALIESERDDAGNRALAAVLRDLAGEADLAAQREKAWLERQIGRLLGTLPDELSRPIALAFLAHRRKGRREVGFKRLAMSVIDDELSTAFMVRFRETGDIGFLKTLVKQPLRLAVVDAHELIDYFDEDYWKMRVVEATLRADFQIGISFARTHPLPLVWASGRRGDARLLPIISECLRVANDKAALIGIVAWAYGKLGAFAELAALEPLLDQLEDESAIDWDAITARRKDQIAPRA